jgi:hypothetical protein
MRACHTDNCPVGIATQKPGLRSRLIVDESARRLAQFLGSAVELMVVLARACGHDRLDQFTIDDLTTFDREMAHLSGIAYGGISLSEDVVLRGVPARSRSSVHGRDA